MSNETTPNPNDASSSRRPYFMNNPDNAPNTCWPDEQSRIESMLQSYIQSYKKSVQDIKESQLAIVKKAQQTTKAYVEKNEQCIHLMDDLNRSQEEIKELNLTLDEIRQKEETMREKWHDLFSRFTGIEKKYDTEIYNARITIDKLSSQLDERTMSVAEYEIELGDLRRNQQALSNQLNSSNAAHNNEIQNLQAINIRLEDENSQLTANVKTLREEIAEKIACYKDLTLSMQKSMMTTNDQKTEFENAVKHHELELKEAQYVRETLEGNLAHKEQDCQKLLQQNQQLSKEIQDMRQKSELELNEKKEEIEKLYTHNQNVTQSYMSEEELYKEKIANLQAETEKLHEVIQKQEEEIITLTIDIETVCQSKEEQQSTKTRIEEEKAKLQKVFEEKEKLMQEKLRDLKKELSRKDNEFLDLERMKNSTIAELKYKMNKIGTVFGQSVGSATVFQETNEPDPSTSKNQTPLNKSEKTIKTRPRSPDSESSDDVVFSVPTPVKRSRTMRSSGGRKPVYNVSDFEDDTSEDDYIPIVDLVKSSKKKSKISSPRSKKNDRLDTAAPPDPLPLDIFDELKSVA